MRKTIFWTAMILTLILNIRCSVPAKGLSDIKRGPRSIDFESIIENAKEKVFPALIFVKPTLEQYERGERKQILVYGSGVIISPDGYAVTNNHVVEKAIRIKCVLYDRRLCSVKLIGRDKDTDLALIKIETGNPSEIFPYAEWGDSDKLEPGHFVMALGAPWGYTRSISLGIVGNAERFIEKSYGEEYSHYSLWIQTDASINPGNSGGPLINTQGKIVGINTLGHAWGGDMAFSVPSNTAKRIVDHLKKNGKVKRSWTGIRIQPLRDLKRETILDRDTGVLVASVDQDSPAQRVGIQMGDLILKVNNIEINGVYNTELPEIRWFLGDLSVDQPAEFEIERNGKIIKVQITPREKGKVEGDDFDCKRWDMTVKEINEFAEPDLFYYQKKGVYVQGVQYPGNANTAGIRARDIIVTVGKQSITSLDDMKQLYEKIMKDEEREKKLLLKILRSGVPRMIVLKYDIDYDKE